MKDVEAVSSGSISLDIALGVGGLRSRIPSRDLRPGVLGQDHPRPPRGRRGPEEGRHRRVRGRRARARRGLRAELGVRTDDLLISQPDTGEQALEIAETLVRSGRSTCS